MCIISQLWLTSHPRSTVALLDTGTPGTSREIYSEDADDGTRLELFGNHGNHPITMRGQVPSSADNALSENNT